LTLHIGHPRRETNLFEMSKEIPTIIKVDPKKGAVGQQGLQ